MAIALALLAKRPAQTARHSAGALSPRPLPMAAPATQVPDAGGLLEPRRHVAACGLRLVRALARRRRGLELLAHRGLPGRAVRRLAPRPVPPPRWADALLVSAASARLQL